MVDREEFLGESVAFDLFASPFRLEYAPMIPEDDSRPGPSSRSRERHDPFQALRFRDFRLLAIAHFVGVLGEQMVGVAIGWELYERTGSALALGMVGLVQVIPVFLFALPAGHVADRFNRKAIVAVTQCVFAVAAMGLVLVSRATGPIWLMYLCLFAIGAARAFRNPAASTLLPHTVPNEAYQNAATWNSGSWQLAVVCGPALGGFVLGWTGHPFVVYAVDVVASLMYLVLVAAMHVSPRPEQHEEITLRSFGAGATFIWRTREILAAITLDMFAVLLGGATALLPIFARDILFVGPTGLGWLRAAPSIGAMISAFAIASRPPFRRAGWTLLWAVAGFGAATIVFGLSRSFGLSLLMLATLGALDQISVVIRGTLLLLRTPDALRGRVYAVHNMFLGASNELGEFESGALAAVFGPVIAVVGGGIGTLVVVALTITLRSRMSPRAIAISATVCFLAYSAAPSYMTTIRDQSNSTQYRVEMWASGIDMVKDSPVFGIGRGNFRQFTHRLIAHNSAIEIMGETGLVGLFLWSAIGYLTFASLIAWRAHATDPSDRRFSTGLILALMGYLISSMFVTLEYITYYALVAVSASAARGAGFEWQLRPRDVARIVGGIIVWLVALQLFVIRYMS